MPPAFDNYFKFIRKMIPEKKLGTAIGLDIGTQECRMVEISSKGHSYELMQWAVEPIQGELSSVIRKVLPQTQAPVKNFYTSVFGKGTLIRYLQMPRMSRQDLKNSFTLEADKYFPFPSDQIYTDCCILEEFRQKNTMLVMAVAVRRELIDQYLKLLMDLGACPSAIGINAASLANVVQVLGWSQEASAPAVSEKTGTALLEMEDNVSNLTVYLDNIPRLTRDIFLGTADLTKKISNTLGMSLEEAERLQQNPQERLEEILTACEGTIRNFIQELRLSFDYFSTEHQGDVQQIFLTVNGAFFQRVMEEFSKELEIKVATWNPVSSLSVNPRVDLDDLQKNTHKLGVALGSALYHYA